MVRGTEKLISNVFDNVMNKKLFGIIALAALVSCSGNDKIEVGKNGGSTSDGVSILVSVDDVDGIGTRTSLSYSDGATNWSAGDQIKVFDKYGKAALFTYKEDKGNGIAQFTQDSADDGFSLGSDFSSFAAAYYPGDKATGIQDASDPSATIISTPVITATITGTQTWVSGSFGNGAAPMVSTVVQDNGGSPEIRFKNAFALVEIPVYFEDTQYTTEVSSIEMTAASTNLNGPCSITMGASNTITSVSCSGTGASTTTKLTCTGSGNLSGSSSPTKFIIAVPSLNDMESVSVKIKPSNTTLKEKNLSFTANNTSASEENKKNVVKTNQLLTMASCKIDNGPYADFPNTSFNAKFVAPNINSGETNYNQIVFSGASQSGWEVAWIPIKNLEIGSWYTISFGESVIYRTSTVNWWCSEGTYATTINGTQIDAGNTTNTALKLNVGQNPCLYGYAFCPGSIGTAPYNPESNAHLTFKATAETMYWIWELSQFNDGITYTWKFILNSPIQKIKPDNTVYADMPNATMYGYIGEIQVAGAVGADSGNRTQGLNTYKIYADYHSIEFHSVGGAAHEKFNVPLKGLTVGKTYKLKFDYTRTPIGFEETFGSDDFDNCFGISENEDTKIGSSGLHGTSGFGANFKATNLVGYEITFTATKETMYWIWSQSQLPDVVRYKQIANNITLVEVP